MALSTGAIAALSAIGGAVGIVLIGFTYAKINQGFRPGTRTLTVPFIILQYFLPYFIAFYVLISDALTSTVALSPSLIVAIILVVGNWAAGRLPPESPPVSDICGIPGLSSLYSTHLPQSPLFVSALFGYIVTYVSMTPSLSNQKLAAGLLWLAFAILQYSTLMMNKDACLTNFTGLMGKIGGGSLSPIVAMILGGGIGALGGYGGSQIIQKYFPTIAPPPSSTPNGSSSSTGASPPSDVGTCSPPNDQDQFVCEAYKDGKLVTSTIASS